MTEPVDERQKAAEFQLLWTPNAGWLVHEIWNSGWIIERERNERFGLLVVPKARALAAEREVERLRGVLRAAIGELGRAAETESKELIAEYARDFVEAARAALADNRTGGTDE